VSRGGSPRALDTALAALLTLVAACTEVDITVAQVGAGASEPCSGNADCVEAGSAFCAKASCAATSGTCLPLPSICPDSWAPVCGCDGVNYWNDCLRQRDGVAASAQGVCSLGFVTCNDTDAASCPVGDAICDRLDPQSHAPGAPCKLLPIGVCRVMPDQCPPPDAGGPVWQSCGETGGPPGSGTGGKPPPNECVDTCNATKLGLPYRRVETCH